MATKKNNITVGLIKGNTKNSNETKHDVKLFNKNIKDGMKREKMVEPVLLISRLNYPETVKYDGKMIRISPRSKLTVADVLQRKGIDVSTIQGTNPNVSALQSQIDSQGQLIGKLKDDIEELKMVINTFSTLEDFNKLPKPLEVLFKVVSCITIGTPSFVK